LESRSNNNAPAYRATRFRIYGVFAVYHTLGFDVAVSPYREKLVPFLESVGVLEARRLKLENHFHNEDHQALDRWLSIKEVESNARSKAREEDAITIARDANTIALAAATSASDANDIARSAKKYAFIAAIAAIVAAIAAIKWR
jgi:hypothetical protein